MPEPAPYTVLVGIAMSYTEPPEPAPYKLVLVGIAMSMSHTLHRQSPHPTMVLVGMAMRGIQSTLTVGLLDRGVRGNTKRGSVCSSPSDSTPPDSHPTHSAGENGEERDPIDLDWRSVGSGGKRELKRNN